MVTKMNTTVASTYDKYGESDQCVAGTGTGGVWSSDVYEIPCGLYLCHYTYTIILLLYCSNYYYTVILLH